MTTFIKFLILFSLLASPAWAIKEYAVEFPTGNPIEVYSPNNPPSGGSGTVASVATDSTLTGGPITTTGTLGIDLTHANTWTGKQIFNTFAPQIGALTASNVIFTDASKNLTSTGFGTSSQFIKGDGSLDGGTYLTAVDKFTKAMTVSTAALNFGGI